MAVYTEQQRLEREAAGMSVWSSDEVSDDSPTDESPTAAASVDAGLGETSPRSNNSNIDAKNAVLTQSSRKSGQSLAIQQPSSRVSQLAASLFLQPESSEASAADAANTTACLDFGDSEQQISILKKVLMTVTGLLVGVSLSWCCCSNGKDEIARLSDALEKQQNQLADFKESNVIEQVLEEQREKGIERGNRALKDLYSVYVRNALKKLYRTDEDFKKQLGSVSHEDLDKALDSALARNLNLKEDEAEAEIAKKMEFVRKSALESAVKDYNDRRIRIADKRTNFSGHVSGLCYGIPGCAAYACYHCEVAKWFHTGDGGQSYFCANCPLIGPNWEACAFYFGFFVMFGLMCLWALEFFYAESYDSNFVGIVDEEGFLAINPKWALDNFDEHDCA